MVRACVRACVCVCVCVCVRARARAHVNACVYMSYDSVRCICVHVRMYVYIPVSRGCMCKHVDKCEHRALTCARARERVRSKEWKMKFIHLYTARLLTCPRIARATSQDATRSK